MGWREGRPAPRWLPARLWRAMNDLTFHAVSEERFSDIGCLTARAHSRRSAGSPRATVQSQTQRRHRAGCKSHGRGVSTLFWGTRVARSGRLPGGHTVHTAEPPRPPSTSPAKSASHPPVSTRARLLGARRRLLRSGPVLAQSWGRGPLLCTWAGGPRFLLRSLWRRQSYPDGLPQTAHGAGRVRLPRRGG